MSEIGCGIMFAHTAFKWANLAAFNAGVTVIIVGFGPTNGSVRRIFIPDEGGGAESKEVDRINGYLVPAEEIFVLKRRAPLLDRHELDRGTAPVDDGNLVLEESESRRFVSNEPSVEPLLKPAVGGATSSTAGVDGSFMCRTRAGSIHRETRALPHRRPSCRLPKKQFQGSNPPARCPTVRVRGGSCEARLRRSSCRICIQSAAST